MSSDRNSLCSCGSGKKQLKCCFNQSSDINPNVLPKGIFKYICGSYGDEFRGYFSSILCKKMTPQGLWIDHYCLINPNKVLDNEDIAAVTAVTDFNNAKDSSNNPIEFAEHLKAAGYGKLDEFKIVCVTSD